MAGFVSYSVVNDKAFNENVKRASALVKDLRPAFKVIANDFYLSQKAIFKLKSPGGYPDFKGPSIGQRRQAPLDPKYETATRKSIPSQFDGYTPYQYYKEKATGMSKGYPLLKRNGEIEASTTTSKAPGSILVIEPLDMEIGTDVPYAHIHQDGGPVIPQRKFMFIGKESQFVGDDNIYGRLGRWNKTLLEFVVKQTGKAIPQSETR